MSIEKLVLYFNNYITLNSKEVMALSERVTERKIKRRQFILQENDYCKNHNFIVSGCFKMYSIDHSGKEHIIQFGEEDKWLTDLGSMHLGTKSRLVIEAIEPSVILQIELEDLVYLFKHYPKFNIVFRVITENNFIELKERVLQNISYTAEERYTSFLVKYPVLSKRLPNTHIASYLGITPEFLSTIRKNITSK